MNTATVVEQDIHAASNRVIAKYETKLAAAKAAEVEAANKEAAASKELEAARKQLRHAMEVAAKAAANEKILQDPRYIKLEDVERTYNGRTGCACGCGGTYTEENVICTTTKKRVNFVNRNLDRLEDFGFCVEVVTPNTNPDGEFDRVTRIYLKKGSK
jgi:hypothetical protein